MSSINWDEFAGPAVDGDFPDQYKFVNVGDTISGTIVALRVANFSDGRKPELYIETAEGVRSVIAGQVMLQRLLAEKRPNVGDKIAIRLTGIENKGAGKTLKVFEVVTKPGDTPPTPAAPEPAAVGMSALSADDL
jgi:hypothetical protein